MNLIHGPEWKVLGLLFSKEDSSWIGKELSDLGGLASLHRGMEEI